MWLETTSVSMSDGVKLATDVYRPEPGGRWPTLLLRTPYGKRRFYSLPPALAQKGYAVIVQDVRGRHSSEGTFDFAAGEENDSRDTLDWIRDQKWCSGLVGLIGPSYCGWCGLSILDQVDAAVLIAAPVDWHHVIYPGGILQLHWALPWADEMSGAEVTADWMQKFDSWEMDGEHSKLMKTWLEHPRAEDDYWQSRRVEPRHLNVSTPVLICGGAYDFLLEETLRSWAWTRGQGAKKLMIGPWSHHTLLNPARGLLDVDFGSDSALELSSTLDLWFSAHFNGGVSECGRSAQVFVTGGGGWQHLSDWPPIEASVELHCEFTGNDEADLHYDPVDPPPTVGGRCWPLPTARGLQPGPSIQDALKRRRDVAVFNGPPLTDPVTSAGDGSCNIDVKASAKTVLVCDLVDLAPDRTARIIAESEPITVGPGTEGVVFTFGAVAHRFNAGHAVGLQVKCGSFPRYERALSSSRVSIGVRACTLNSNML